MTEVEKMYKNAHIARVNCKNCTFFIDNEYCEALNDETKECPFPPFTAEKQIEIIKLITSLQPLEITLTTDSEYYFSTYNLPSGFNKDFAEALANIVNNLWQDLKPITQEKIKGILR